MPLGKLVQLGKMEGASKIQSQVKFSESRAGWGNKRAEKESRG
jgi:hypothetical protein